MPNKTDIRISLYGFRAESSQVENQFRMFFQKHASIKIPKFRAFNTADTFKLRAFLINFPDARVSDLGSDRRDMDYITIKCSNKKVLDAINKMLAKDEILGKHFIDYQQPVSFTTSGHI